MNKKSIVAASVVGLVVCVGGAWVYLAHTFEQNVHSMIDQLKASPYVHLDGVTVYKYRFRATLDKPSINMKALIGEQSDGMRHFGTLDWYSGQQLHVSFNPFKRTVCVRPTGDTRVVAVATRDSQKTDVLTLKRDGDLNRMSMTIKLKGWALHIPKDAPLSARIDYILQHTESFAFKAKNGSITVLDHQKPVVTFDSFSLHVKPTFEVGADGKRQLVTTEEYGFEKLAVYSNVEKHSGLFETTTRINFDEVISSDQPFYDVLTLHTVLQKGVQDSFGQKRTVNNTESRLDFKQKKFSILYKAESVFSADFRKLYVPMIQEINKSMSLKVSDAQVADFMPLLETYNPVKENFSIEGSWANNQIACAFNFGVDWNVHSENVHIKAVIDTPSILKVMRKESKPIALLKENLTLSLNIKHIDVLLDEVQAYNQRVAKAVNIDLTPEMVSKGREIAEHIVHLIGQKTDHDYILNVEVTPQSDVTVKGIPFSEILNMGSMYVLGKALGPNQDNHQQRVE
jgi:hypothetical protein